jgi:hypothetical protein
MAEQAQKSPLVALDTNFLLDLADDNEACWDCLEALQQVNRPPKLVATATVLQELAHLFENGDTREKRDLAHKALQSLVGWGVNPLAFIPVGNGIIERIGDKIRAKGLLPEEEINDSYVIAEAALANCRLLVSSDGHVLGIDREALSQLLNSFDVEPTVIMRPAQVAAKFAKK